MNGNIWVLASADSVAIATTLILAALGALFTERSGVLNLGIEGILLTAAISSFLAADSSGSIWVGLLVGSLAGALLASIHAFLPSLVQLDAFFHDIIAFSRSHTKSWPDAEISLFIQLN